MSKRGENIYKRKDNRWEGRYIKGSDGHGKTVFGYVYAKSYREVREKLATAKQLAEDLPANRQNFAYYCDEWLMLSRNRVKESTYVKYRSIIARHLEPKLGGELPQHLSTVFIEDFSNTLLCSGLSPKTVRDILTVVKSVLKHCHRQIGAQFPDVEVVYPKVPRKTARVLSAEEQKALVHYLLDDMDRVKFGVLLALFTGMRIGELCALKWGDISLRDGVVSVNSTMQRLQSAEPFAATKTRVMIGKAKSDTSQRMIPLTSTAAELCRRMWEEDETAYVLTGHSVRYMEPRALQYRLTKYTEECGLNGVHFHTLRHTFATRCVEVGFEIKSLSEILGHSSAKVTLDRYVHTSLELKRANMSKLATVGF